MKKEYVFIFRDDEGAIIAVNRNFEHGLKEALNIVGKNLMLDPVTGNFYPISTIASSVDTSITYRNIDEIFDYNLTCLKWLISD